MPDNHFREPSIIHYNNMESFYQKKHLQTEADFWMRCET